MAERSAISWTHSTFNPWLGCTKISPGCDACYAEALDRRHQWGGAKHWGAGVPRRRTSASNWRQPLAWNRNAKASGQRHLVFCASLADVFDNEAPEGAREDLWELIRSTPSLTWQLVTKRIGNARLMLPKDWGRGWANVWLLSTIVNQEEADRDIHELPCMFTDLPHVCAWPRVPCVPCHGNWQVLGRGFSFKTDDNFFAAGCPVAHDIIDGRRSPLPGETAWWEWLRAHVKTMRVIYERGLLVVTSR